MVHPNKENEYQEITRHIRLSGGEAAGLQFDELIASEGRVSSIKVYGQDEVNLEVVTADPEDLQNNPGSFTRLEEFTLAGASEYETGTFSEPLFKFGAQNAVVVNTLTPNPADTIVGINITIHERTG